MTHLIENAIAAGNRLAFTQSCTYPDGTKVFCSAPQKRKDRAADRHSGLGRLTRDGALPAELRSASIVYLEPNTRD
jgi:hypothetical protein